jgi:O-antigen ligase
VPSHTDVVVTTTGASAALAGLILVFLGVLIAAYQPLVGAQTPDKILRRFKSATVWALVVFGLSLVSVVLDATWLITRGGHCFYVATVVLFFVQLAALAATACYSTIGVLLKG